MSVPPLVNNGRPTPRRAALLALASFFLATVGADPARRAPRFEGKSIPEPPAQGQPWTPPPTKLPKFLVDATAALFDQGVPDPRDCEYRDVEVGDWAVRKARGFVLPERPDVPGRFFVAWDGLVYPALTVGEPADLDADVRGLVKVVRKNREASEANPRRWYGGGYLWGFPGDRQGSFGISGVDDHSPVKLALLLRIGRADLAEALFAAGTTWTPAPRVRDLTDYRISYLSLAGDWAASAFQRLIAAHIRGDDVVALDAARRLSKFRAAVDAKADAMGFPLPERQSFEGDGRPPRFYFLKQLPELLADHERRAKMPARTPIPKKGGDPSARIAALIRDLDQIDEQQMMSPGAAHPGGSPLVKELIAEGDPAVGPLLAVLESDDRLTRSVSNSRGGAVGGYVHPVYDPAFHALVGILKTNEFQNTFFPLQNGDPAARKALAASIRAFWEKTRSIPLTERWYRTLLDDKAGPERWLEAAGGIVSAEVKEGEPFPKPGTRPMKGEALRAGRDPSVTALMIRRVADLDRTSNPMSFPDFAFGRACGMALDLVAWDEKAALPTLRALMKECRERSDAWVGQDERQRPHFDQSLSSSIAEFAEIRDRLGDAGALDEYAAWLRTTSPKMLEFGRDAALGPLLAHRDHPSIASAARWLFNDPKSPWVPLVSEARNRDANPFQNILASSLVVLPAFREALLAGLADRGRLGTVRLGEKGTLHYSYDGGQQINSGSSNLELDGIPTGVEIPFRDCDYVAWTLSSLEGAPRCEPYWPEPRRDEAVDACAAYLKRYADRFTTDPPPGVHDFPDKQAHLKFPTLDRPATAEDVASALAIFSMEGRGEARVVKLPGLPQPARWLTLRDTPVDRTYQDGVTRREYDTEGLVWQAEEVRVADRWERFYGFVGHHTIARAPASEVEFSGERYRWANLPGGLDARAETIEPRESGFEPGRPIVVALRVRNRMGGDRSSPTEFLRPGADGKPALRRGVGLALWYSSKKGPRSGMNAVYPDDAVKPRRDVHFDPGDASKSLAPLEAFEAMRFDVRDWFDVSKPGRYRLRATFATDAGVGEGTSGDAYFQVGGDE